MDSARLTHLRAWITAAGLSGIEEKDMLAGFCERVREAGVPIDRGSVIVDTLHPSYEGQVFHWRRGEAPRTPQRYGRTSEGDSSESWRRSPFYRMIERGEALARRRIAEIGEDEHPIIPELRAAGMTEYITMISRFGEERVIGEMDCVYFGWSTRHPDCFSERHVAALEELVPHFALAIKAISLGRIANTLVETYLGRDAGRRVMSGSIQRGVAERIEAALWFSDLHDYTRILDTAAPGQIIPLLNDYAEAVISAIHAQGGDVLKLMGDGILAIFTGDDRALNCRSALAAGFGARTAVAALNQRRAAEELPTTNMYLALHIGEVFFGNIGSAERLDFTVVGPAVNEVSRIAAMCRSVDQQLLVSSAFAAALGRERAGFASVGRYALRGVGGAQDLYTPQA